MPTEADQPGWRPDPERPGMVRWWNGLGWSDARRTADQAMDRVRSAADDALRGSTITPQEVARANADRSGTRGVPSAVVGRAVGAVNPFAVAALSIGVISVLFGGFFGVLALVGLVVSLAGLARSRRLARNGERRTGLGQSLAGLVLSLIGLVRWVPLVLAVLGDAVPDLLNS